MSREMYAVINTSVSWNSNVSFTSHACQELAFWRLNVDPLNYFLPWQLPTQSSRFVYSDTSDEACASLIVSVGKVFRQNWSPEGSTKSSSWRELKTVELALLSLLSSLQAKRVVRFTDNVNVVSILLNGSIVSELQLSALRISQVCVRFGIRHEEDSQGI